MSQPTAKKPLEFAEARRLVIDTLRPLLRVGKSENIPLGAAHGRVLAEDIKADRDYPALERSLRDGFAIRSKDAPGSLSIRGEIRAGEPETTPLGVGQTVEIMTGAPVPAGADAVVMVETVQRLPDAQVLIDKAVEAGQFINPRGAEARAGSILIPASTVLDASHIATLAMTGHSSVNVYRQPAVAILATGDEIVPLTQPPHPHQIRNSNSYMLAALIEASGAAATILPVAADTRDALLPLLEEGLTHDMLVVSGGVSAGKYDLVKPALQSLGVHFHFERVRVQPGQPTAFGTKGHQPVFGLPGNPGSTLITFQLFAKPAIELLCGVKEPLLPLLSATFEAPFSHKLGLTRFLPAFLNADGRSLRHIPWQGSSDIPALAKANVFLVADHDRQDWAIGDTIRVMLKP